MEIFSADKVEAVETYPFTNSKTNQVSIEKLERILNWVEQSCIKKSKHTKTWKTKFKNTKNLSRKSNRSKIWSRQSKHKTSTSTRERRNSYLKSFFISSSLFKQLKQCKKVSTRDRGKEREREREREKGKEKVKEKEKEKEKKREREREREKEKESEREILLWKDELYRQTT